MQGSSDVIDNVQVYKLKTFGLKGNPESVKLGVGTTFFNERLGIQVLIKKIKIYFILKYRSKRNFYSKR